eukprot:1159326-Pelagomonas_calceolata.AAC.6
MPFIIGLGVKQSSLTAAEAVNVWCCLHWHFPMRVTRVPKKHQEGASEEAIAAGVAHAQAHLLQ